MTTLNLNPRKGTSWASKTEGVSTQNVMMMIKEEHPQADFSKLEGLYIDIVLADPALTRACVRAQAARDNANIEQLRRPPPIPASAGPTEQYKAAQEEREAERTQVVAKAAHVARQVQENFMIEGIKRMRFSDVTKLAKKHKQLVALSKMGQPNQIVSDVLNDEQIKKTLR